MERPLQFDSVTVNFEPLKYARIQVELTYDAPRQDFFWVSVLNYEGKEERMKVEIKYPKCFTRVDILCLDAWTTQMPPEKGLRQEELESTTLAQPAHLKHQASGVLPHLRQMGQMGPLLELLLLPAHLTCRRTLWET